MTSDPPDPQPAAPPPPSPPAPPGTGDSGKASGGMRALALLGVLLLAFAVAVMVALMLGLQDDPLCEDVEQTPFGPVEDCYEISAFQKTIALILGWPGVVLGVLAVLAGLNFVTTGRRGPLFAKLTGVTVLLGGLSILVGSI